LCVVASMKPSVLRREVSRAIGLAVCFAGGVLMRLRALPSREIRTLVPRRIFRRVAFELLVEPFSEVAEDASAGLAAFSASRSFAVGLTVEVPV